MKKILTFLTGIMMTLTCAVQAEGGVWPAKSLAGIEVTCTLQDEEGYWWYGGRNTGLCRFDGYDTEAFRSDRQNPYLLRSNDVLCMTELRGNAEIWFGTKEGAYILSKRDYQVRPIVLKTETEDNELADKRINCMMTAADSSVWMSYRNQLLHLSANAILLERFETTWEGRNRSVSRIRFDAAGHLFAELWNGGIIRLKKDNGEWWMEPTPLSSLDTDESSEPASEEEVKQMLDSVMASQAPKNDAVALSWAKLPDGKDFFVGSYHSLYFYDGKLAERLQTDLDKVRSMAYSEQLQTLFLLSKARGVCQWTDGRLTVLCDSTKFHHLYLSGDSALLLSDGMTGLNMLNLRTRELTVDTTTADVNPLATAYVTDGRKYPVVYGTQTLSLPKDIDIVEIFLSTLDYSHASQVQFAYRMDDDEWTLLPMGEHVAKFARLSGGTHRLQVRATDAYGRWSAPKTVLEIECSVPWYGHTWLWLLLLAATTVVAAYTIKRIHDRRKDSGKETAVGEETVMSVADREFIDKAVAAVAANMINSDYSVDSLAGDLCMSRANLHRKMRSITGLTPTDFIRNQRLERAAHLLRTTSHSVNEISDLVGFSYASYFSKCFKEKYGVLPKDYQ